MKRTICISIYLLMTGIIFAQTQQGYVKTKGRLGTNGTVIAGTRLSGATVTIKGGNTVVSENNGTFSLAIPGDGYYLQSVQKQGYVLTDPDVLAKQYDYSKNPLVLVLETPSQQTDDKLAAERKIRRTLQQQLQDKEDEIEALKEQQKLSVEEYRKQLQEIYAQQESNEKLISEMAERYSKIDFDEVDEFNRRISQLVLEGKLTEADSLLNTKGDINSRAAMLRQHQEANALAEEEIQKKQKKLEKSKAMTQKELDDLAQDCYSKFEIFKMQHQKDSAYNYLQLRATLDTTNVQWVSEVGNYVMKYMANYDLAKTCFDQSLSRSLSMYGRLNIRTAQSYFNLGELMIEMGRAEEAITNYQQAYDIFENVASEQATDVAGCLNGIGLALIILGDNTKGIDYLNQGLDMLLKAKGEINEEVAAIYVNLGIGYNRMKDSGKALECQQKALHIKQQITTVPKSSIAVVYNNIAMIYNDSKEYEQAMEYFQNSLELYQSDYGETHPTVAICYGNIGMVYFDKKDFPNALIYYQKELDMCKSIIGDEHPNVAKCYNNIASVYESIKDYQKALEYYQLALNTISKTFNKEHPVIKMLHGSIHRIETKIKDVE